MANKIPPPEATVRRQQLGQGLQALRKAAGFTLEQAARRIDVSPSKLCRIERGSRSVTTAEIGGLLSIYDVDGPQRRHLLELAANCGERDWWQRNGLDPTDRQRTLIALESRAERIVNVHPFVIPGLLQTGEYTRAMMTESGLLVEGEIEKNMLTRQNRQAVLTRGQPPRYLAIIHELALHQVIGGPDVRRRQLEELLQWFDQPNVEIRILPNAGAHAGLSGAFDVLELSGRGAVVFLENLTSSLFVEDPNDVDLYWRAVRSLSSRVLDEQRSYEMIATQARCLERGVNTYGGDQLTYVGVAQEQPFGPPGELR
jgi:transcriptional regulator with XRE-family HTH domain